MEAECPFKLTLSDIWRSWYSFRRGKRKTLELEAFSYNLEGNLSWLYDDIVHGKYRHGQYKTFTVCDNKKRTIRVAPICDRVVHRLLYDYLVNIYDRTFIYDVWSCRASKGLVGAINRTQKFLSKNANGFVWRADIAKFFDNVDQAVLWQILARKIKDKKALVFLREVIGSYSSEARSTHTHRLHREKEYRLVI